MTSEQLLVKSKHFPRKLNGKFPIRPEFFSVDPNEFELKPNIHIRFSTVVEEGIYIVRKQTEELKREHSIMLYGKRIGDDYYFEGFYSQKAERNSATYSPSQKLETMQHLKEKNNEVIYGHSHVAYGREYNKFSITDLNYYVRRAIETERDVYAVLITRDKVILIVYDYAKQEFFRIAN